LHTQFIFASPPFQSCHAATLAETPAGLVMACFGGSREGHPDVGIWAARQVDADWLPPVQAAVGIQDGQRFPCWNPVLYQPPGGALLLFYKVGPNPERWWGMVMDSVDGGQSWSAPRRLPEGILGPVKNKPLRLADGSLLCPSSSEHNGWQVRMECTPDLGQTWEQCVVVGAFQAIQPALLQHASGRLQILCRSTHGCLVTSWSQDGGRSWSALEKTELPNPNSGIDALTLTDGRHVLVYNPAGIPSGKWGGPRTPLVLAVSADGLQWKTALSLESASGEYSYPALIQSTDERIHVLYTWQRRNIRYVTFNPAELSV